MTDVGRLIVDPFVSINSFRAHPTYLDLQNLRSGDLIAADQDDELFNLLLESSGWAEDYCRKPLRGHVKTDYTRVTPDRFGRLYIYPTEPPVRQVLSIAYSMQAGGVGQVTVNNPVVTIEDGSQVVYEIGASAFSWSGPLQFGGPVPGYPLYVTMIYASGWTATTVSTPVAAGATAVTVNDPTGLQPLDMLRVWDPSFDETLYVASTWTPVNTYPPVPTSIPLVAPTLYPHSQAATVSGLPPSVHLAIVHKTIDLLQRPGEQNSQYPGSRVRSQTKNDHDEAGSDHEARAMRILTPFRDVR